MQKNVNREKKHFNVIYFCQFNMKKRNLLVSLYIFFAYCDAVMLKNAKKSDMIRNVI